MLSLLYVWECASQTEVLPWYLLLKAAYISVTWIINNIRIRKQCPVTQIRVKSMEVLSPISESRAGAEYDKCDMEHKHTTVCYLHRSRVIRKVMKYSSSILFNTRNNRSSFIHSHIKYDLQTLPAWVDIKMQIWVVQNSYQASKAMDKALSAIKLFKMLK